MRLPRALFGAQIGAVPAPGRALSSVVRGTVEGSMSKSEFFRIYRGGRNLPWYLIAVLARLLEQAATSCCRACQCRAQDGQRTHRAFGRGETIEAGVMAPRPARPIRGPLSPWPVTAPPGATPARATQPAQPRPAQAGQPARPRPAQPAAAPAAQARAGRSASTADSGGKCGGIGQRHARTRGLGPTCITPTWPCCPCNPQVNCLAGGAKDPQARQLELTRQGAFALSKK